MYISHTRLRIGLFPILVDGGWLRNNESDPHGQYAIRGKADGTSGIWRNKRRSIGEWDRCGVWKKKPNSEWVMLSLHMFFRLWWSEVSLLWILSQLLVLDFLFKQKPAAAGTLKFCTSTPSHRLPSGFFQSWKPGRVGLFKGNYIFLWLQILCRSLVTPFHMFFCVFNENLPGRAKKHHLLQEMTHAM